MPTVSTFAVDALSPRDGDELLLMVCQVRGVADAAEVRRRVVAGSLGVDCAAMNADMVFSPACLLAAAMRAHMHESRGKLVTKTIHSELLLMMSGGRRINEAFKVFGISDTSTNLLLACFAKREDKVRRRGTAAPACTPARRRAPPTRARRASPGRSAGSDRR